MRQRQSSDETMLSAPTPWQPPEYTSVTDRLHCCFFSVAARTEKNGRVAQFLQLWPLVQTSAAWDR